MTTRRHLARLAVLAALIALPTLALAQWAIHHVGGKVTVPNDTAAWSARADGGFSSPAWPTAPYACRDITVVNIDASATCWVKWITVAGLPTAAIPLRPQDEGSPFAASSRADGLPYATDVQVKTSTADGGSCDLVIRCAVDRRG